ncbi:MAG: toll/interleukin-1 receptor domain-containing protein [Steroidobacteraceae bacterium]
MTATDTPAAPRHPQPTVFLSYASEDRHAAQLIRDALPALGLEVWYDESALDGGDAWDQKIRRQIRECDYFMPVISAQTEARAEGYFRREWRLAAERTLDMADDYTFLLPVVIDATTQAGARVPEKFLAVQWMRLPGGQPTPALEALCRRLVSGHGRDDAPQPVRRVADQAAKPGTRPAGRGYPEIPRQEPGQRLRFFVQVIGWALQSAWVFFRGFPRWVQILVYLWIGILVLSRGCSSWDERSADERSAKVPVVAPANPAGSLSREEAAKLGAQIARDVTGMVGAQVEGEAGAGGGRPLLAIPFSAPADDAAAKQLAAAAFSQVYGKVMFAHRGQVGLSAAPLPTPDAGAAAERGRTHHSRYVLFGAVDDTATPHSLSVKMVSVADGSVLWSESFPLASADPARIATEVASRVPSLADEDD